MYPYGDSHALLSLGGTAAARIACIAAAMPMACGLFMKSPAELTAPMSLNLGYFRQN